MDMTRDFLNGILALDAQHELDYQGRKFVDRAMLPLPQEATAKPLTTSTLTSIVDYITSNTDERGLPANGKFVIHVAGHDSVELYKELNADKERDHLLSVSFEGSNFPYGRFQPIENFIINLQSLFVQDEQTAALLGFIGSVKNDSSVEQSDDGVSQKATVKQGISLAKNATVPNPVYLKPFRTFSEIDQPQSAFVFRLRKDEREGVTAALFEADGAAWKHEAIASIQTFLTDELGDAPVIILA